MKLREKIVVGIVISAIILCGIVIYLSRFHLYFSQNYRSIDGYENIVFKDLRNEQCFHLCAWGLIKTENVVGFEEHRNLDITSNEYRLIVENTNARECDIWQVVPSPDGKYILYVERIYNGLGVTDEEDVYYKVYSIEDDKSITVFYGYKQFLRVDWK